jgi:hypothetical protein
MRIDPKVEGPTRDMLDHAMRGDLEKIDEVIHRLGSDQRFRECVGLCLLVAGYVAVDVCGSQWPSEASIHKIAENVAAAEKRFRLDPSEVHDFLGRGALRLEPLDQVFPDLSEAALLPILATASLLLTYRPRDKDPWDYLDEIEEATETAATIKPSVLPAMILRAHTPTADAAG